MIKPRALPLVAPTELAALESVFPGGMKYCTITLVEVPGGKFCRSLETLLDCPNAMLAVNRIIATKSNSREPHTAPLGNSVVITFFSLLYEGIEELPSF